MIAVQCFASKRSEFFSCSVQMASATLRSVFRPDLFAGKVAVVTGGGTGIGRAITTELALLGCKVVIASRKLERLETAAREITETLTTSTSQLNDRPQVIPFQCNIRSEDEVKKLMQHTLSKLGRLDYLVNNGGGQFPLAVENISAKGWHAVVETNLTGTFYCCKHAYNEWMQDNGGSIVNITASIWNGMPSMAHTGAARAGVQNLMKSMTVEWAKSGVRINCVAPGGIYSDTAAGNYSDGKEFFRSFLRITPAGRLGLPEEVAGVVCFLLSPAASYLTSTTVKVDGGRSLYQLHYIASDEARYPPPLEDQDLMAKLP